MAATIATDPETGVNFAALIYPVISMDDGINHTGSKKNLLGDSPSDSLVHLISRSVQWPDQMKAWMTSIDMPADGDECVERASDTLPANLDRRIRYILYPAVPPWLLPR